MYSAGQVGPYSQFFNDLSAPEHKDAETLGTALFNNESFEGWADLYKINSASIFFVTTAFTGLLAKGSKDVEGHWSSVVNITSMSGVIKLAQNHVSLLNSPTISISKPPLTYDFFFGNQVLLQQRQSSRRASNEDV